MNALARSLRRKISERKARVGVIGLGYVGLPLAVEFAEAGFRVVGIDVDEAKVRGIRRGRSHVEDVPHDAVAPLVKRRRLSARDNYRGCGEFDAIVICVPTPLRKTKDPDISYIVAAVDAIAGQLRRGQLVILESTTYPGTTEEVLRPRLESGGLRAGRDFFLAFSPERVDPGN
ncbi:MAG: nucleotide sugar dehydrogenase, partial [Planctomycetota bacterium]